MNRKLPYFALCLVLLNACNEQTLSLLPLSEDAAAGARTDAGSPDAAVADDAGSPELGAGGVESVWPLDGDASDSVGDNHGSPRGEVAFEQDAERGSVLRCNGTDSTIEVANRTTGDFSYALWLWTRVPSARGETALDGSAILWSNVTGLEDDFTLSLLNDKLSYMSYSLASTGSRELVDGAWHHVVLTRRDGERVALYVDGEVDGDGNSGAGGVAGNPSLSFCGNPEQGNYFDGKLDDVRYFPRVLSAEEVRALYRATTLP